MTLSNISSKVLEVTRPVSASNTKLAVATGQLGRVSDRLAYESAPGSCLLIRCVVPTGAKLTATSDQPVSLTFAVSISDTVRANSARALGAWIEARIGSRIQAFTGKVQACATNAREAFTSSSPRIEDALRSALEGYGSCRSLVSEITSPGEPAAAESQVGEILRVGRTVEGGSFNDELVRVGVRIFGER